jgi:hypothetical protein
VKDPKTRQVQTLVASLVYVTERPLYRAHQIPKKNGFANEDHIQHVIKRHVGAGRHIELCAGPEDGILPVWQIKTLPYRPDTIANKLVVLPVK